MGTKSIVVIVATAAAVLTCGACGSEPKKEPATATPPAAASEAPAPSAEPAATPAASAATPAADAGAAKDSKQAECDQLMDDANSSLDAERIAHDKLCKKDADCMPIKGRACGFACTTGAIPKAEEKGWNETVKKVQDGQCKKWNDNECAKLKTKPAPTCQDRKIWCDKGHCSLK